MDVKFMGSNGGEDMETIKVEDISEFTLKKYLLRAREISLLTKKYTVGGMEIRFANLTLGKESNIKEVDGKILADLMFEYNEYRAFEQYGEVIYRKGYNLIKVEVSIAKEAIMVAAARIK